MAKKKKLEGNDLLSPKVMGIIGLALGAIALFGLKAGVALAALAVGGFSVFRAVRNQEYEYMFLGMVAMLMALLAVWRWAQLVSAAY